MREIAWRQCMRWARLREGVMELGKWEGGDKGRMRKARERVGGGRV